jgi:putative DNA primase/helicase
MLSTAHQTHLAHSALSHPIIQQRGYVSLDHPGEALDCHFSKTQSRLVPGLLIPLWDVHGAQSGVSLRPDAPRQYKDGKINKYELPPGVTLTLDCHPAVQPALGNPTVPLFITEGVKKGDALASLGACTIALNGVWGFRGKNAHGGQVILPEWEHVALNERVVYIVYDNDVTRKTTVQQALRALRSFLQDRQALPQVIYLPDSEYKVGVDDFLAQGHTMEDLLALAEPQTQRRVRSREHIRDDHAWRRQLEYTANGTLKPTYFNVGMFLKHHHFWQDRFWLDVMHNRPMLGDLPVDDVTITRITQWFGEYESLPLTQTRQVKDALAAECADHPRDLLREEILALPHWDQQPRLKTWLTQIAGVAADAYGQAVAQLLPVSMIARAMDPGQLYRFVVILQGPQESGKSELVRLLSGDEWYGELMQDLESKEAQMRLQGKWVVELAELHALSRTQETRMKAFISLREDVFIPKYSNSEVRHPRRCIFVGTTNQHAYLRDATGNTRYLPIETGPQIDLEAFEMLRTQLLAEALAYYKAHSKDWWRLSDEARQLAEEKRDNVGELRVYQETLEDWIPRYLSNPEHILTWDAIAEHCLQIKREGWTNKALQAEVTQTLQMMGYRRAKRLSLDGQRVRPWVRDGPEPGSDC